MGFQGVVEKIIETTDVVRHFIRKFVSKDLQLAFVL
jgi:hypothetical protein